MDHGPHTFCFGAFDDRGQPATICGLASFEALARLPRSEIARTPRGAAEIIQRLTPTREVWSARAPIPRLLFAIAAITDLSLIAAIVWLFSALRALHLTIALVLAFPAAVIFLILARTLLSRRTQEPDLRSIPTTAAVLADFAHAGDCLACGGPLKVAQPEPDGCVTCTGCGAAWRFGPPAFE